MKLATTMSTALTLTLTFACGNGVPDGRKPPADLAKKIFDARSRGLTDDQRGSIQAACGVDVGQFCPSVKASDDNYFREIAACLHEHADDLSDGCSNAFQRICGDSGDLCDFDHNYGGLPDKLCLPPLIPFNGICFPPCAKGLTFFEGRCLDLNNDPNNCGAIGNVCPTDNGDPCLDGVCVASCPDTGKSTDCGGTCTDLNHDPNSCGACGNRCIPPVNGTTACDLDRAGNPACIDTCNPNYTQVIDEKTGDSTCTCKAPNVEKDGVCSKPGRCLDDKRWTRVTSVCTRTDSGVPFLWSINRSYKTVPLAGEAHALGTGCQHFGGTEATGLCSLDGKGWVSTSTFVMKGCDASWVHLFGGASPTEDCRGHDGDVVRKLVVGDDDCYDYEDDPPPVPVLLQRSQPQGPLSASPRK